MSELLELCLHTLCIYSQYQFRMQTDQCFNKTENGSLSNTILLQCLGCTEVFFLAQFNNDRIHQRRYFFVKTAKKVIQV